MTKTDVSRRKRGHSPRGDFEQSKSGATDMISKAKIAEQAKSMGLKALREKRETEIKSSN